VRATKCGETSFVGHITKYREVPYEIKKKSIYQNMKVRLLKWLKTYFQKGVVISHDMIRLM